MRLTRILSAASSGAAELRELQAKRWQDLPYPLGWLLGLGVTGAGTALYVDRRATAGHHALQSLVVSQGQALQSQLNNQGQALKSQLNKSLQTCFH
jgi:hypothetical protein